MVIRPSTYTTVWELWSRSTGPKLRNIGPQVAHRTKGAFKFIRPPTVSAPKPPTSQITHALNSFLRSISDGVTKSFKTGGNYNGRLVHAQPNHRGFDAVIRTRHPRPSPRFGPSPRPASYPSHVAHVGLGAARNFSSARPIFQNIVENVPLGLRALVDQGGIDERKWRSERRSLRALEKKALKGKGRSVPSKEKWHHEFANYFDSPSPVASAVDVDIEEFTHPIVLSLPLEPSLSLSSHSAFLDDTSLTSYRILSPSTLQAFIDIESSYLHHSRLIRALSNRLSSAGVFDDPDVTVNMLFRPDGYKEVQVAFGGRWTERDVRQAAGIWGERAAGGGGEFREEWFEIRDLRKDGVVSPTLMESEDGGVGLEVGRNLFFDYENEIENEDERGSSCGSSYASQGQGEDLPFSDSEVHDVIARTLILPSFYTPPLSLSSSSTSSEFDSEFDLEAPISPMRSFSPSPETEGEGSVWDDDLTLSSVSPTASLGDNLVDQSGWEDASTSASAFVEGDSEWDAGTGMTDSYESGLRTFLSQLDEVDSARTGSERQEGRGRGAMFARF